jgi:hypothetical protein
LVNLLEEEKEAPTTENIPKNIVRVKEMSQGPIPLEIHYHHHR